MRIRKAPKTENAYLLLKKRITEGEYPGDVLPMEPELAEQLHVSRNTVRSALVRLALENYVVRIKGKGTFINRAAEAGGRILVLVWNEEDVTDPNRYILPGIEKEAAAMNLQVETCTGLSLTAGPADATLRRLREKNYRGILCMDSNFSGGEPIVDILKKTGLPVLLPHAYERDAEVTGFAAMGTDYTGVVRDGLRYLIGLGHRRIAYLAHRERRIGRKGYFRMAAELGLDPDPELYVESPSYNDSGIIKKTIEDFLAGTRRKPTAVFCFSDFFAACLYECLGRRGIRIPEDMAILSIGGMIGCDFLTPPLSALDFGCSEIGRDAVRILMEMVMKKELTRPFTVTPHHLTERESTRKPSGKEFSL